MRIPTTLFFLFGLIYGFSQPCDYPYPPSNKCFDAPILCSLDNYCSNNKNATNSGEIDAFCGVVENNNWISFIADTKELEIEVTVSNCQKGFGLQVQFFSTINFIDFAAVSDCLDPVLTKDTITAKNLISGKRYYLMMDGKATDICDYSYKVLQGNTFSSAFAKIKQPEILCENESIILEADIPVLNAKLKYQWSTTDGHIKSQTQFSYAEIDQPGTYKLVVSDDESCMDSIEITIKSTPNPIVSIESPEIIDCKLNKEITLQASSDNTIDNYFWSSLDGHIISGKNTSNPLIDKSGLYQVVVSNPETGCSSTSIIEVIADNDTPNVQLSSEGELNCINPTLILDGSGSSKGDIFSYSWSTDSGHFQNENPDLTAIVDQPGTYILQISNTENGCTSAMKLVVTLNDEQPTGADISTFQPCFDESLGVINIENVIGGTLPYLFAFNDTIFKTPNFRDSLLPDEYHIVIQDATGCEWDTIVQIVQKPELIIDLGSDLFVNLGEDVNLNLDINIPESSIDSIFWMPNFECDTCLNHNFIPLKSQEYNVKIVDKNGCKVQDQLNITVNKKRNIYIPNVFSPNYDGINDEFFLFGGIGIESVVSFEIYDRWGSKICAHYDFQPNDRHFGWDGLINGKEADQGVYIYTALVKYIDGEVLDYVGDLTLMH